MSKESQHNPTDDLPPSTGDLKTTLKLDDDIVFPGDSSPSPKSDLGPGAYSICIPSKNALGTAAEYEQVHAFCGELNALEDVGAVTRLGVTSGIWSITFSLDCGGKSLSSEVVRTAFAALKPKLDSTEVLQTGFVSDDLPFWRLMNGTKVVKKGNFKRTT